MAVVGAGLLGSATARALAARGVPTLLFEQFALGHARGSSHGATRIFRYSYPDPYYVEMAVRAGEAWARLTADAGEELLVRTGGLDAGPGAEDCAKALAACGVAHTWLSDGEVRARFPGIAAQPRRADAVPAGLGRFPGRAHGRGAAATGPPRWCRDPGRYPGARHRGRPRPGAAAHRGGRGHRADGGDHGRALGAGRAGRGTPPGAPADGHGAAGAVFRAAGSGHRVADTDRVGARGPGLVRGARCRSRTGDKGGRSRPWPGGGPARRAVHRDRPGAGRGGGRVCA